MTSNVRSPRDDEEELKAQIAILRGQSKSLKDVLTDILNEEPSEDFVDAVENNILLEHGSLLVMKKDCQEYYEHSLPENPEYLNPRVNLTFRKYGF